jgi:hypothetical protein
MTAVRLTRMLCCLTSTRFDCVLYPGLVDLAHIRLPEKFIQKTFEIARANVRVNGRNLDEVPEAEEGTFNARRFGLSLTVASRL